MAGTERGDLDERIKEPLRTRVARNPDQIYAVAVELATTLPGGVHEALAKLKELVEKAMSGARVPAEVPDDAPVAFLDLSGKAIQTVLEGDRKPLRALVQVEQDGPGFDRENLVTTVIAQPLLGKVVSNPVGLYSVIIDLNLDYHGGRDDARQRVVQLIGEAGGDPARVRKRGDATHPYLFAKLTGAVIQAIVGQDREAAEKARQEAEKTRQEAIENAPRTAAEVVAHGNQNALFLYQAIYRVWEDSQVHALIDRTVATVKADAAHVSFSARGRNIVWAVLDSGIDGTHPHFNKYQNLEPPPPIKHRDFTRDLPAVPPRQPASIVGPPGGEAAAGVEKADQEPLQLEAASVAAGLENGVLVDTFGHGTHVAGIIAGYMPDSNGKKPKVVRKTRQETGSIAYEDSELPVISGMAPECKLVSMKVLDERGNGQVSYIIEAIEAIQRVNDYGRRILIHGVNMSVGYEFEPEWFACGQSPLCVEVNRLVRSGVVVVVAAGNTGYGFVQSADRAQTVAAGMALSINDPGNADLAITVGATHRDMPHTYGVSYFSSKGPTGDGRLKPDLVAPGEKIISCAMGRMKTKLMAKSGKADDFTYMEESGTSMAAPHVSGVIAAFLSIRREFLGEPEKVKQIFLASATDLRRERSFQGAGLVDLMRAIQSV